MSAPLGAVYFCYYAGVGVLMPYWGLYAAGLGLSPAAIGTVVAAPMLTKMIAPNLWAAWADRGGRHLGAVRAGAGLAALAALLLPYADNFGSLLAATLLFSFFWNAILPQIEVVTLDSLASRDQTGRYGRVRLWGSIGFIAAAVGLGDWLAGVDIERAPLALLAAVSCTALVVWWLPRPAASGATATQSGGARVCLWFFVAAFLLQISHGVFYGFFSLYLRDSGYSGSAIGLLWGVGVLAEVLLFWWSPPLLLRLGLRCGYLLAAGAAVLRWQLMACCVADAFIILTAQLLHALTFALAHAVAIETVRRYFPGVRRGAGQAFYSALCFGGGAALGSWGGGFLYGVEPSVAFHGAAVAAALSLLVAFVVKWPPAPAAGHP